MQADTVYDGGAIHRTRPRSPNLLKRLKKDKIDPRIHTGYFHTCEANTLVFIVDGGNAVSYFVMRSQIPQNMVVPFDNTTASCSRKKCVVESGGQ